MKMLLIATFACFVTASLHAVNLSEIDELPNIRDKILKDTHELRSGSTGGSTAKLVDAGVKIQNKLLPSLIKLEAELEKKKKDDVTKEIKRDLEAVERDVHIRGYSEGEGGSENLVEAVYTGVSHIEARISYYVWQLTKDSKDFDFETWHRRWTSETYY
jgi:hypothetical protein